MRSSTPDIGVTGEFKLALHHGNRVTISRGDKEMTLEFGLDEMPFIYKALLQRTSARWFTDYQNWWLTEDLESVSERVFTRVSEIVFEGVGDRDIWLSDGFSSMIVPLKQHGALLDSIREFCSGIKR